MRRFVITVLVASAAVACSADRSAPPVETAAASKARPAVLSPGGTLDDVMKAKLIHAHALLEAIALESFTQIEHQASELAFLSELSEWQVHRTEQYRLLSDEFRAVARRLAGRAAAEDLPGACAEYLALTEACVRCHEYLREEGLAR
ncbi:MAG: hypothetical protein ACYTJ0_11840 [Planctomycetota bacterium]|jgi:hypothetical protein